MEVKEMTISDVLKTPEFYNNLKVVISDLENIRRNARISANAPLKRHPIDRLQERGVFEPGQMTVLSARDISKPVLQLKNGVIVKEYNSINEAAKINGFSPIAICKVCKGERKNHKGYMWRYKNEKA